MESGGTLPILKRFLEGLQRFFYHAVRGVVSEKGWWQTLHELYVVTRIRINHKCFDSLSVGNEGLGILHVPKVIGTKQDLTCGLRIWYWTVFVVTTWGDLVEL